MNVFDFRRPRTVADLVASVTAVTSITAVMVTGLVWPGEAHASGRGAGGRSLLMTHNERKAILARQEQAVRAMVDQAFTVVDEIQLLADTPDMHGYQKASRADVVRERHTEFLQRPEANLTEIFEVIAYRDRDTRAPEARLLLPTWSEEGVWELTQREEDGEGSLSFDQLDGLIHQGYTLHTRVGSIRRPQERSLPHNIWWPADNDGPTLDHVLEVLAQPDTKMAKILAHFLKQENHTRRFTSREVAIALQPAAFADGDNPALVNNTSSKISNLLSFGLLQDRGPAGGPTARLYQALTPEEIRAWDRASNSDRVNHYLNPRSRPDKVDKIGNAILNHVYTSLRPTDRFDADSLAADLPTVTREQARFRLRWLWKARVIQLTESGTYGPGAKPATYAPLPGVTLANRSGAAGRT